MTSHYKYVTKNEKEIWFGKWRHDLINQVQLYVMSVTFLQLSVMMVLKVLLLNFE